MPHSVSHSTAAASAASGASALCRPHFSVRKAQNRNNAAMAANTQSSSMGSSFRMG